MTTAFGSVFVGQYPEWVLPGYVPEPEPEDLGHKQRRIVRFEPSSPLPPVALLERGALWPDGSKVLGFWNAGGGALLVKLYSPDFRIVPEGGVIPTVDSRELGFTL